jgi:hypothetical protein
MENGLNNLDAEQGMLLLFLAGELSAEQRQALEVKLANDVALREKLEALRSVDEMLAGGMGVELGRGSAAEAVAVRDVSRLIRNWDVRRKVLPVEPKSARWRRAPAWVYPSAAAAMVLVGLLAWWGNRHDDVLVSEQVVAPAVPVVADEDENPFDPMAQIVDLDSTADVTRVERGYGDLVYLKELSASGWTTAN